MPGGEARLVLIWDEVPAEGDGEREEGEGGEGEGAFLWLVLLLMLVGVVGWSDRCGFAC